MSEAILMTFIKTKLWKTPKWAWGFSVSVICTSCYIKKNIRVIEKAFTILLDEDCFNQNHICAYFNFKEFDMIGHGIGHKIKFLTVIVFSLRNWEANNFRPFWVWASSLARTFVKVWMTGKVAVGKFSWNCKVLNVSLL